VGTVILTAVLLEYLLVEYDTVLISRELPTFCSSILKDIQEYLIDDEGRNFLLTVGDYQSTWRHIQLALNL
jgi:hypothetical protein